MGMFFRKKIKAVVFSWNGIPKACGCESIIRVHFVLDAALIIIYFFEIVNNFYITLNRWLLFVWDWTLSNFNSLFPFFFLFTFFFAYKFGWSFWSAFPFGTSRSSRCFTMTNLRGRVRVWKLGLKILLVERGVVLKAQRSHRFYQINN